jgi:hypothetical protein
MSILTAVDIHSLIFSPHRRDVTSNGQTDDVYSVPAVVATDDAEIVAYEIGAVEQFAEIAEE